MPVLLVGSEDSPMKARLDALSSAGFTVLPVGGFLDARQILTELEPEAIVTDVQLGDYNGLHLVAIAQVEHPRTVCLVMGLRDPALQAEAYEEKDELDARRALLMQAMSVLNDREKDVLMQRRLAEDPVTLEELSESYGVSRERIRQIEVRAFEKLQKAMREAAREQGLVDAN
mgnify:CR=1 FL=1